MVNYHRENLEVVYSSLTTILFTIQLRVRFLNSKSPRMSNEMSTAVVHGQHTFMEGTPLMLYS